MADNKIERKRVLSRKAKSEDAKSITENGISARRTTISNASASSKSQLSHMYGSLTETDQTYKVIIVGEAKFIVRKGSA